MLVKRQFPVMGLLYKEGLEVLQRDAVWWQSLSRRLAELLPVTGWGGKTPHRSSYMALISPPANVTEGSELSPWEGLDSPSWILVDEKHSFSPSESYEEPSCHTPQWAQELLSEAPTKNLCRSNAGPALFRAFIDSQTSHIYKGKIQGLPWWSSG